MLPLSVPIGSLSVYLSNIMLIVSWLLFSFVFWRGLRRWGIEEDRIFDNTFYSTIAALIFARFFYVITHWHIFAGKSWLLIAALWVTPGLSWLGGLIGGTVVSVVIGRMHKIRAGWILDTLALALPLPIIIGKFASFVHVLEVGRTAMLPWSVMYANAQGLRHPVQLYEMLTMAFLSLAIVRLNVIAARKKLRHGLVGMWFFFFYSSTTFLLEFFKDTPVYWGSLTANQWVLIGIFAESVGVLYIRGGGKEQMRRVIRTVRSFITKKGLRLYAAISKRHID